MGGRDGRYEDVCACVSVEICTQTRMGWREEEQSEESNSDGGIES